MSDRRALLLVLFVTVLGVGRPTAATPGGAYRIIVNPGNPQSSIERRVLADMFLKKVTRWGAGDPVRPVDQGIDTAVRQRFSDEVLGRSVGAVKSYWAQVVFSGRDVPPPELDGDEEVVRYVLKHVGAIGYVSAGANLDGAKILGVR